MDKGARAMHKVEFLTIFASYSKLDVVKKTLPTVISEVKNSNSALIVHDSTEKKHGRDEKWDYLRNLSDEFGFMLLLSSNISMGTARNTCLSMGQELFTPDYICMMEDDHGFKKGMISNMSQAMKKYYGKKAPNGLVFGLFTGCSSCRNGSVIKVDNNNFCPGAKEKVGTLGGTNSCCRCAPTSHWNNVLKGYDTDEYLISGFQTRNLNARNYNKGFTVCIVNNGEGMFFVNNVGRGVTDNGLKRWDDKYTANDSRAKYKND